MRFALALLAAAPAVAFAQTWRTFDASRSLRDTAALAVHVQYGAGRVRVQSSSVTRLYDVHLKYDADHAEPLYRFDPAARTLDVGIRHVTVGKGMGGEDSELQLGLSKSTPLRLTLDVGAAEGEYDLSGLALEELSLHTGATDTRVRFTEPNPRSLRTLSLQVGAASLQFEGLGNANVRHIELNLGVGSATLDFSGAWRDDVDMTVASALGKVKLRVPADVGVRVESSTFLHSLDAAGFIKKNGYVVSPNYDGARYKLQIRSTGAFGQLEIERAR
jgi:hypothetical protein